MITDRQGNIKPIREHKVNHFVADLRRVLYLLQILQYNMADMMLKERQAHIEQIKPDSLPFARLGVMCHRCNTVEATTYYGQHNTYPSCKNCDDILNREFDENYK